MKQLTIAPSGIGSLLSNKLMAVPIYQRSYAWKEPHVKKLLRDVNRAITRPPPANGAPFPYFLGSIVVIQRPSGGRLEIVDGQQRLATTSILIAAIRDSLLGPNAK